MVLVHGAFNYLRGKTPEQAALDKVSEFSPKLADGFARARLSPNVPELVMAYYAHLLRVDLPEQAQAAGDVAGFEDLTGGQRADAAEWLVAAGAPVPGDPQNVGLAPLRQMLGWLIDERGGVLASSVREHTMRRVERAIVANLREVEAYTSWSNRRELVRERVAEVIRRERPAVVVAHSLGSFVTYETLHAFPELEVELLVTVGSPLRVPSLTRRLDPALRGGRGSRPSG
ncbi:hypothetical protein, partial [Streptomyces antimycoticus]|uniref:hypothetical protein n=1 Tax=Streptomyces antimycoticus TaxID=68175 RepID=UPI000A36E86D